jgi:hypothetical protein
MNRFYYFAGFAYIALCGVLVARELMRPRLEPSVAYPADPMPAPVEPSGTDAQRWFAAMKPYCNSVEVEVRTRYTPPPATAEGAGYHAACFGLAGKITRAQSIIGMLDASARGTAANIVFEVAHPIADAGDDRSSGPMMQLVVTYWPSNYMAMYHAGMSEYALGQLPAAKQHLNAFLQMYNADDGFTQNAKRALESMQGSGFWRTKPVERDQPARR